MLQINLKSIIQRSKADRLSLGAFFECEDKIFSINVSPLMCGNCLLGKDLRDVTPIGDIIALFERFNLMPMYIALETVALGDSNIANAFARVDACMFVRDADDLFASPQPHHINMETAIQLHYLFDIPLYVEEALYQEMDFLYEMPQRIIEAIESEGIFPEKEVYIEE